MSFASKFRNSKSLVVVTRLDDGQIVDINPAFEAITGYKRKETLGRTTIELNIWHDAKLRDSALRTLVKSRSITNLPITLQNRAGVPYPGLLTAEIIELGGVPHVFAIVQDITAYNEREAALRYMEERYRAIFENAVEGMYQSTPDGRVIEANPALARLLGYDSPAELMHTINNVATQVYLRPELRDELLQILDEQGSFSNMEFEIYRKNGDRIWVSENARAVKNSRGEVLFYEGTLIDVSPRKSAEEALKSSEDKYRTLIEQSQDGVFIVQNNDYLFVNKTYASMLGHRPGDMIGRPFMQFIAPEDHAKMEAIWRKRLAGEWEKQAYEVSLLRSDGRSRILASVKAGPITYNGKLASTGTVRDITEQRRREAALREAEDKYRQLFHNAVAGMYQSTPEGRFIDANPALAQMFGYDSPEDLMENLQDIRQLYAQPSQREVFLADLNREGSVTGLEYQILRRDGRMIWVSQNARVVRNADGSVKNYEGVLQDITARKQAEEALHKSEERYRALVENSQVGVFVNREGRYIYVNSAFARMLGYTEDELTGKNYREIFAPEDLSAADERFQRRLRGEHVPNDYETRLLHKDGQTRIIVTISISVLEQHEGKLMMGMARDVTEQKRIERQLRHNATHDPLTGLPNRTLFVEKLQRAMQYGRGGNDSDYAVLFVDLDGFKLVNDSLGHATGDQLLVEIAHRLKKCLRPWDTIARHGGDEFTILVEQIRSLDDTLDVAERIHTSLRTPFQLGDHQIFTNASIGIAPGHAGYQHTDELLRDADTAMYKAKAMGKAATIIFDSSMHDFARARLRLETELRQALERNEFRIFYQPIFNLKNRRLTGFEALLRWEHPTRGLLLPADFLAVAEDAGMLVAIGWWVLHEACRQVALWQRTLPGADALSISVNIADRQLTHADLPVRVAEALQQSGLDPGKLNLEITENVFIVNPAHAGNVLRRLKTLGVNLHMDDFGTGYSSLSYLSQLPLDTLKIDRSFVSDIQENKTHLSVVKTIVQLAKDLGMSAVAEGIESYKQAKMLNKIGCPSGQGLFFAGAMPAHEAEDFIAAQKPKLIRL